MVLDHVPNDSKLVKVSAASPSSDVLFKIYNDVVNVVPVPHAGEDRVSKAQDEQILAAQECKEA